MSGWLRSWKKLRKFPQICQIVQALDIVKILCKIVWSYYHIGSIIKTKPIWTCGIVVHVAISYVLPTSFLGPLITWQPIVARKISNYVGKILSCDNQPLPGPSTSRSTTEALGTRLMPYLNTQSHIHSLVNNILMVTDWCTPRHGGIRILLFFWPTNKETKSCQFNNTMQAFRVDWYIYE